MRRARDPHKLPRHPEWQLATPFAATDRTLSLRYGAAELHLRFWPRASAALQLAPGGRWIDGSRHAERLFCRFGKHVPDQHIRIGRHIHRIAPDGQLYFASVCENEHSPEIHEAGQAVMMALSHIPQSVRRAVQGFRTQQWATLRIVSRISAARELLLDHPILFWLWLRRATQQPQGLMRHYPHAILLKKLPLKLVMNHLKAPRRPIHEMLRPIQALMQRFPQAKAAIRIPSDIDELAHESHIAERALEVLNEDMGTSVRNPFSGLDGTQHLGRIEQLIEEGIHQRNCLRTDAPEYLNESTLVYRITHPVRATLHLRQGKRGNWQIAQFRQRYNKAVSAATSLEVFRKLTGYALPDLRTLPRVDFFQEWSGSTHLFQLLTNSRALWALYGLGEISLHPDEMLPELISGESRIYRIRSTERAVIEHIWEHANDRFDLLGHSGCDHETWAGHALRLDDYQPIQDIWSLYQFCWDTGACIAQKEIFEGKGTPFYCSYDGWSLAVVVKFHKDRWRVQQLFARDDRLEIEGSSVCDAIIAHIEQSWQDWEANESWQAAPEEAHPRTLPKLPEIRDERCELSNPDYYRVALARR